MVDLGNEAPKMRGRIIAPDRPGHGLSDLQRGRRILAWPEDVAALADTLGIERFAVLGLSGGAPCALACAYAMPERLTATGIVSGMGPASAPGMREGVSWVLPGKPALARRLLLRLTAVGLQRNPAQFVARSKEALSPPDAELLDEPAFGAAYVGSLKEAFRAGPLGPSRGPALHRPWGFSLEDITARVHLWHGEMDLNVPVAVAEHVSAALPHCSSTILGSEGHLTLSYHHIKGILGTLARVA